MKIVFWDRVSDRVRPGQSWCPCLRTVMDEATGWPLAAKVGSQHVCPHCPSEDNQVECGALHCSHGHMAGEANRFARQRLPPRFEASALEVLEHEIVARMPPGTYVEVEIWEGCDEDWGLPVYVGAWPTPRPVDHASPYHDAVCDLGAAALDQQAAYVVSQLLDG